MPNDRNRRRLIVAAAAALVLVFAGDLDRARPHGGPAGLARRRGARKRRRRAPDRVPGQARRDPPGPAQIDCTLHHANAEKKGWGYLASSGPPQPAVAGKTYSFVFTVPDREDTAYAFAIIYLSPTGKWQDGTRAVSTKYIPLIREGGPATAIGLRKTPVHRYPTAAESERMKTRAVRPRGRPSVWIHPVLAALLLAAAFSAVRAGGRSKAAALPGEAGERTVWLVFAALLAVGAALEISGIAGHVAAWGRRLAEQQGVYELRRPFQKAVMAATAAASLGLFILFIRATRRPGSHRYLLVGRDRPGGVPGGLVRRRAVRSMRSTSARRLVWHGVSPVDAARGAGATVTLVASWLSVRRKSGRAPI